MLTLNSTIYVVCTPDYVPVVAFTSERKAQEYLVSEIVNKGVAYQLEYVNLEIDEIFLKRMEVMKNSISVRKKNKGGK